MRCYRDGNEGNCRNRILNYRKEENSAGPAILILLDKLKAWVEQIQIVVLGKNTKNLDKSELCTVLSKNSNLFQRKF